jgi:hypothetical protein
VTVGSIHRMQSINVVILNAFLESVDALPIVEGQIGKREVNCYNRDY